MCRHSRSHISWLVSHLSSRISPHFFFLLTDMLSAQLICCDCFLLFYLHCLNYSQFDLIRYGSIVSYRLRFVFQERNYTIRYFNFHITIVLCYLHRSNICRSFLLHYLNFCKIGYSSRHVRIFIYQFDYFTVCVLHGSGLCVHSLLNRVQLNLSSFLRHISLTGWI